MENQDNKILKLLDESFVKALLEKEVLPKYPDFTAIRKVKIKPAKKLIWQHTYHVVFCYETSFVEKKGSIRKLPIFCSAHSSEPRKNVHDVLKFLWSHNFAKGNLTIPHPMFYSEEFNATFYRGVNGENLYHFIKRNNRSEVEAILPRAAAWFAKLHHLPANEENVFNQENSRIRTVVPGLDRVLSDIENNYYELLPLYRQLYDIFIKNEEEFLASTSKRWYVHGDAHPENVIKMGKHKLALIDFTDLSLSDFARDLGTFLQQLEYMANRKIGDPAYTEKLKKLFLDSYLKESKIRLTEELTARINNYYNWTAIRTATFFLMKHDPQPERAMPLLKDVCKNLGIRPEAL